MAQTHTTDPREDEKREKMYYAGRHASLDSQGDLIAEFAKQVLKRSRNAVVVEYLLNNKKEIRTAMRSLFDIDPVEVKKFVVKKFYKDVFLINVDTKLMKYHQTDDAYGMFMHIPPQLSFDDVVERLRVKGVKIDLTDDQIKEGGGRLGYTQGYSFLFHSEYVKEDAVVKDEDFKKVPLTDPRKRLMNRMEYLICSYYLWWYWGENMNCWTLLDFGNDVKTIGIASSPFQHHKFQFLPHDKFIGLHSFEGGVESLRIREIYLL